MAGRNVAWPRCSTGGSLLSLLSVLVIGIGMARGADRGADEVDDKLIMADYSGTNRPGTIAERRGSLDKLAHSVVLKIRIREWPLKITVMDPTDADGIRELRDGDRGFVWQMTRDQLQGFVAKLMPIRRRITVCIEQSEVARIGEIEAWLAALKFDVIEKER